MMKRCKVICCENSQIDQFDHFQPLQDEAHIEGIYGYCQIHTLDQLRYANAKQNYGGENE